MEQRNRAAAGGLRRLFSPRRGAAAAAGIVFLGWLAACALGPSTPDASPVDLPLAQDVGLLAWRPGALKARVEAIVDAAAAGEPHPPLTVVHPLDGALFPRDLAAPEFLWQDPADGVRRWLLRLRLPGGGPEIRVLCGRPNWRPDEAVWETIKSQTLAASAEIVILGVDDTGERVVSQARVHIATSPDPVGAPLFFQQIPLPFARAFERVGQFRWLLADLSAPEPPPTVLDKMPRCAFCHTFAADGDSFGMDMDYGGDKGGFLLADLAARTRLSGRTRISWNDLPAPPGMPHMGLFAKLSPDGRYAMATVGERPFMAVLDHLDYSQLFFPLTGQLAWYDRQSERMRRLPGADDRRFVQTSPAWSPDGQRIYFARAPVDRELAAVMGRRRVLPVAPGTDIHALNRRYRIRFDIYHVAFNAGRGGLPLPLAGASGNGRSNYFPRVSPDGRWVVFTQSPTGLVAQPDSRLMIVPAEGGQARPMRCNQGRFNSWHSWSPNGRWLVFTSKVHTPYTELFLTHVAPDGSDSPPVRLWRLSHPKRAAVIPEFVNRPPAAPLALTFTG